MQRNKDIKNISEIENYTSNDSLLLSTYERVLNAFNLWGINRMLSDVKERGVSPISLFQTLVILPFFNIDNIYNLFLSGIQNQVEGSKNAFYRFQKNEWIPWRKVLYAFARQFKKRTEERCGKHTTDTPTCLILDDTICHKTGKKIEYVGKVHDHSSMCYPLGYKALLCGFCDGKSFLPLDFSFHQEPGTHGDCGMKKDELEAQFSKVRSPYSEGYIRASELRESKIDKGIEMIKTARRQGFHSEYVLTDSWYMSASFIQEIQALGGKAKAPHILGLFKTNRKVELHGRTFLLSDLPNLQRSKKRRCKSLKCVYIPLTLLYKKIPLKVFLVRMNGNQGWKALITTDQSLTFIQAMKTYAIRWSIEVCFKDMKQHLKFGKCQALDFDAQIAATTISCIHYIILAFARRHDAYETLGEIFEHMKEKLLQEHLLQILWKLLKTIYVEFLAKLGVFFDDFIHQMIHSEDIKDHINAMAVVLSSSKIKKSNTEWNI